MTLMEEESRRRKALEIRDRIFGNVTRENREGSAGVTPAPETLSSAAEGRGGRCGRPPKGQKIAKSSAAARAPEAAPRATAPEIPERLRRKPDRRENEFMMNLMVLRNTLIRNAPACRDRARLAGKWVWRDIRLMTTLVCRIQEALLRTMPESRDDYYRAYAQHGHYEMRMDGPVRYGREVLITDRHLGTLCEAAMQNECVMCLRDGSEIGQCPLREALLEVAPPTEIQDGRWRKCEYRGAAGDLVHGREVSI